MDLVIFVFASSVSFILTLLASYDRTIGVAGIMLQFVTIGIAGYDGNIIMARGWDGNGTPLNQSIPVYPEFITLGFSLLVVYIVIFMKINKDFSESNKEE